MAVCAQIIVKSDGSYVVLRPGVTDLSQCAYVVETGGVTAWTELGNLSMQNSAQISASVGLVWAIAWGFRAISKSFFNNNGVDNE